MTDQPTDGWTKPGVVALNATKNEIIQNYQLLVMNLDDQDLHFVKVQYVFFSCMLRNSKPHFVHPAALLGSGPEGDEVL